MDIINSHGPQPSGSVTITITDWQVGFKIVDTETRAVLADKTGVNEVSFATLYVNLQNNNPAKAKELRNFIGRWILKNAIANALGLGAVADPGDV